MTGDRLAQVLEQALALMRQGWCKGRNWHKGTNAFCIRGAIAKILTGDPNGTSPLVKATYALLTGMLGIPLEVLNDTADRFEDVEGPLLRAAKEARATA